MRNAREISDGRIDGDLRLQAYHAAGIAPFESSEAPREAWDAASAGDEWAKEALVRHYQSLVAATAYRFKSTLPSYITSDDLLSYGQIGLLRAIDRYDPDLGPFRRFASSYVYGAILDELRAQDWAPRGLRREQRMVREATAELSDSADAPSVATLAARLGWDAARLQSTIRQVANSHHQTLEGAEFEDGVLLDADDLDGILSSDTMCAVFTHTFEAFDEPTQYVLARVYFLHETLTAIAQTTGLQLAVVRRIHLEAISLMFDRARESVSVR